MSALGIERTPAAKRFRKIAGYANYRLNTIVVGLEGVKLGTAIKPDDLAVGWESTNVVTAGTLARGFATNAAMVYMVDALDGYMTDLGGSNIWVADAVTASLLRNEFQTDRSEARPYTVQSFKTFVDTVDTLSSSDDVELAFREFSKIHFGRRKRPSMRARFESLASTSAEKIPEHYDAAVQLLISWRNRHVHGRSTENVSSEIKQVLLGASSKFYDDHSHLNIERMLENYSKGNAPTLKEISSLISIAHRVICRIDHSILSSLDAEQTFIAALRSAFARESQPNKRLKSYWGRSAEVRRGKLAAMAVPFGFRKTTEDQADWPLSLPEANLQTLAGLHRDEFGQLVSVSNN